jgi:outer membrane protein
MRSVRVVFSTVVFAIVSLSVSSAALADETVSVKVGYQSTNISGQFAGNISGVTNQIDMQNDLGFKRSNNVTAEAALQLGDFRLQAGYLPLDFKGSGTLTRTVNFNGVNYQGGIPTTSEVKADIYDIGLTYYLINMNNMPSRFQLGIEPAVKIIHANATMSNSAVGTQQVSATVPIPTIGLRARVALADFLGVVARVGYMSYAKNRFLDLDGQVEFSPVPLLGIYAGYRKMELKADTSGVYLNVNMQGPYVGAFFRF